MTPHFRDRYMVDIIRVQRMPTAALDGCGSAWLSSHPQGRTYLGAERSKYAMVVMGAIETQNVRQNKRQEAFRSRARAHLNNRRIVRVVPRAPDVHQQLPVARSKRSLG